MCKIVCPRHGIVEIGSFEILRALCWIVLPNEEPNLQGFSLIAMHGYHLSLHWINFLILSLTEFLGLSHGL